MEILLVDRAVHPDGDVHEPEGDRSRPDRTRHPSVIPARGSVETAPGSGLDGVRAVGARAVQHDVMTAEGVAVGAGDARERRLEPRVAELLDTATVVADEVMVVLPARQGALEACRPTAEVYPVDEAELGELIQDTVDARDPDLTAVRSQPVEHLLGGQAAVVLAEMGDDRLAGGPRASSRHGSTRRACSVQCSAAVMA